MRILIIGVLVLVAASCDTKKVWELEDQVRELKGQVRKLNHRLHICGCEVTRAADEEKEKRLKEHDQTKLTFDEKMNYNNLCTQIPKLPDDVRKLGEAQLKRLSVKKDEMVGSTYYFSKNFKKLTRRTSITFYYGEGKNLVYTRLYALLVDQEMGSVSQLIFKIDDHAPITIEVKYKNIRTDYNPPNHILQIDKPLLSLDDTEKQRYKQLFDEILTAKLVKVRFVRDHGRSKTINLSEAHLKSMKSMLAAAHIQVCDPLFKKMEEK